MRVSAALPTGVAALFFDAARQRRRLETRLVERLEAEGFAEVMLPILDYLEPYEPLLSGAARGELYRLFDRDGEQLALRSDFTPMLARLLAPRLDSLPRPLKLFYSGDVVRYHDDGSGRQREAYQIGAELLGAPAAMGDGEGAPAGDAPAEEMLRLFLSLLDACGIADTRVVLGFAGCLDGLLLDAVELEDTGLKDTELEDAKRRVHLLTEAVLRRERSAARAASRALLQVVVDGIPEDSDSLGARAGAELRRLLDLRARLAPDFPNVDLRIDLAEFARHHRDPRCHNGGPRRSYYDGLMFRAYGAGGSNPLASGGRYDGLFQQLNVPLPAVGFSLMLDRILEGVPEGVTDCGRDGASETAAGGTA